LARTANNTIEDGIISENGVRACDEKEMNDEEDLTVSVVNMVSK
jgi:hypothetical protein